MASFATCVPQGYKLVSFDIIDDQLTFAEGDDAVSADVVCRDAVAVCHCTPPGHAAQVRLAKIWSQRFGAEPPPPIALRGADDPTALAAHLLPVLVQSWRDSLARSTALMRELAFLRGSFEQAQSAFANLETFLYQTGRAERTQSVSLRHLPGRAPVVLGKDKPVEQRLPGDSAGLSDVAILLDAAPLCAGTLTARLDLMESAEVVAQWAISSADLAKGWVRFSLARALGPDAQTPILQLDWTGPEPLELAPSFAHPDARFRATGSSAVLALNLWRYRPGAAAPLPAEGFAPLLGSPTGRWRIGPSALAAAIDLTRDENLVEFIEWRRALAVRPVGRTASCVRLDNAARQGLSHLWGGIKIESQHGPDVEFCYALASRKKRRTQRGKLPEFAAGLSSEWVRLRPNEWADLHLFLAEPLAEVCDLYLLSRLVDDTAPEQPVDACFYPIDGQAGSALL
ncbi:MAG: DUF6212 domain-containing protein [Pseudomonadota bacterium]